MAVYLRLLRLPRLGRLLLAMLLARLPIGVNGLAIVLFLRAETGSFATAGLVAGALSSPSRSATPPGSPPSSCSAARRPDRRSPASRS
jgi:hypothetical protein